MTVEQQQRAAESQPGRAVYAERLAGAEWVSTGGLAKLAGVSSGRIRQLRTAGELPDPDALMDDGSRTMPIWLASTAEAWAAERAR